MLIHICQRQMWLFASILVVSQSSYSATLRPAPRLHASDSDALIGKTLGLSSSTYRASKDQQAKTWQQYEGASVRPTHVRIKTPTHGNRHNSPVPGRIELVHPSVVRRPRRQHDHGTRLRMPLGASPLVREYIQHTRCAISPSEPVQASGTRGTVYVRPPLPRPHRKRSTLSSLGCLATPRSPSSRAARWKRVRGSPYPRPGGEVRLTLSADPWSEHDGAASNTLARARRRRVQAARRASLLGCMLYSTLRCDAFSAEGGLDCMH
ncbi:hypothetical protein OH77DRAFT_133614 [Trametes cingulata]|nr:hypothetical protein OH77DRAFT_133614 [Trametes cingulata]